MALIYPQSGLKHLQINKKWQSNSDANWTAKWCDNLIFVLEDRTRYPAATLFFNSDLHLRTKNSLKCIYI